MRWGILVDASGHLPLEVPQRQRPLLPARYTQNRESVLGLVDRGNLAMPLVFGDKRGNRAVRTAFRRGGGRSFCCRVGYALIARLRTHAHAADRARVTGVYDREGAIQAWQQDWARKLAHSVRQRWIAAGRGSAARFVLE